MAAPRVFISYSNLDIEFVHRIVEDLKSAGVDAWVAYEQIDSGNFTLGINEGLGTCQWVLLVETPNALASTWVKEEVNTAVNLKHKGRIKGVIPVLAERCPPDSVPPIWDALNTYDATADYGRALSGILRAIGVWKTDPKPATDMPIEETPPTISASDNTVHAEQTRPSESVAWFREFLRRKRLVRLACAIGLLILAIVLFGAWLIYKENSHGGGSKSNTKLY